MSSTVAVAELMATFRMGLLAVIPVAERSHIAWNGPRVYDAWEDIERVFFQSFVTCIPENAIDGPFQPMATYGLHYLSYADFSFLADRPSRLHEQSLVFLELVSSVEPFDTARFVSTDNAFVPTDRSVDIPFCKVRFELAARVGEQIRYLDTVEYKD